MQAMRPLVTVTKLSALIGARTPFVGVLTAFVGVMTPLIGALAPFFGVDTASAAAVRGPTCEPCKQLYGDLVAIEGRVVDVDDILCCLDGFSDPQLCPQADVHPCGGNGVLDVDDILAALDAFSGFFACPHTPRRPEPGPARPWERDIDVATYSSVNTRHGNVFTMIPVGAGPGAGRIFPLLCIDPEGIGGLPDRLWTLEYDADGRVRTFTDPLLLETFSIGYPLNRRLPRRRHLLRPDHPFGTAYFPVKEVLGVERMVADEIAPV